MQTHIGVWLTTRHWALRPHEPGQGSVHFWLMQAKWLEHSLLLTHSGLQFGGDPINCGKHEQEGLSLITWHWAFGPHGDGWHGFIGLITVGTEDENNVNLYPRSSYLGRDNVTEVLTDEFTSQEWVSSVTWRTATYWVVIDYLTLGSEPARSKAWVCTLLITTSFVSPTIWAYYAFRSAWWRTSNVTRNAGAHSLPIYSATKTVRPTGRRITWIFNYWVYIGKKVVENNVV